MLLTPVLAYVDPGIMAVLWQIVCIFLFGAAATFVFRPWRRLLSFFRKSRAEEKTDKEDE